MTFNRKFQLCILTILLFFFFSFPVAEKI